MNTFINNKDDKCYELHIGEYVAKIDYLLTNKGEIVLIRTEVPQPLQGKGVGSKLIELVLKDIENSDLLVVPQCGFVANYISKHPEWYKIVLR